MKLIEPSVTETQDPLIVRKGQEAANLGQKPGDDQDVYEDGGDLF